MSNRHKYDNLIRQGWRLDYKVEPITHATTVGDIVSHYALRGLPTPETLRGRDPTEIYELRVCGYTGDMNGEREATPKKTIQRGDHIVCESFEFIVLRS